MAYRPTTFGSVPQAGTFNTLDGPDGPLEQEPPTSTPTPTGPTNPNQCNCQSFVYEQGHPCFQQCKAQQNPGGGGCPDGTPPGPAPCCPEGQVYRNDAGGKGCEAPDARQKRGQVTCYDVDPVCPPGQGSWCDFDTATKKCAPNGSPGNAGGGGGGGGRGGNSGPGFTDPAVTQAGELWKIIQQRLNGPSRYTPEVTNALLGGTKTLAEANAKRQTEKARGDFAARNILRAPLAAEAERGIRAEADAVVLMEHNKIQRAKLDADFQDRTQAVQEAMQYINSLRDFVARSAATAAQKEVGMANIRLGEQRLLQEMQMMREQYAQQLQLLLLGGYI